MEKRKGKRQKIVPQEIQGIVSRETAKDREPFLVWDISLEGLCIWVGQKLDEGETVTLSLGPPFSLAFKCRVRWCNNREVENGFRCGLEVLDHKERLAQLVSSWK